MVIHELDTIERDLCCLQCGMSLLDGRQQQHAKGILAECSEANVQALRVARCTPRSIWQAGLNTRDSKDCEQASLCSKPGTYWLCDCCRAADQRRANADMKLSR